MWIIRRQAESSLRHYRTLSVVICHCRLKGKGEKLVGGGGRKVQDQLHTITVIRPVLCRTERGSIHSARPSLNAPSPRVDRGPRKTPLVSPREPEITSFISGGALSRAPVLLLHGVRGGLITRQRGEHGEVGVGSGRGGDRKCFIDLVITCCWEKSTANKTHIKNTDFGRSSE